MAYKKNEPKKDKALKEVEVNEKATNVQIKKTKDDKNKLKVVKENEFEYDETLNLVSNNESKSNTFFFVIIILICITALGGFVVFSYMTNDTMDKNFQKTNEIITTTKTDVESLSTEVKELKENQTNNNQTDENNNTQTDGNLMIIQELKQMMQDIIHGNNLHTLNDLINALANKNDPSKKQLQHIDKFPEVTRYFPMPLDEFKGLPSLKKLLGWKVL
ncbi:hypothetical protein HGD80_04100 [Paulownia witches'-broom phytoplasma]|uniref:Effector n=1 Tax=Paulownia witches'-broom phytoplasma TaxID=39647 RepID=A0ABX8TRB7_9MOLU|nr:hypothetical protein [Paulownia witches'-broom phytoplasma]QYC30918.1 hypothetical protein HGD80_04100 [Paulownia witches'-broom phytoplasma]